MARLAGTWLAVLVGVLGVSAPEAVPARKATMTLLDPAAPLAQRIAAARALGKSGDPQAVDALLEVLGTRSEELVQAALASLRTLGAGPGLAGTVSDEGAPAKKRVLAARGLRLLKDSQALPALTRALKSPLLELRKEGCLGLGLLGAPGSVDPLIEVMAGDPEPMVRYLAANALGRIPSPRGRAALEERLPRETDPVVKSALKTALRKQAPAPR
jgi:HEAT repeat protein